MDTPVSTVSYRFDAATFAIYAVGCMQIPLVDFMASPAANVMMVRMGEEIREGRNGKVAPIFHDAVRKLALVLFPLAGLLAVTADAVIGLLFTDRYAASAPLFALSSLGIVFAVLPTDAVMRVFAQTRFLFALNVGRLAFIVLAMGWFLDRLHLAGAVGVTLIGTTFAKTTALIRARRLLGSGVAGLLPWKSLAAIGAAAALSAVATAALRTVLSLDALHLLPVCGGVYMAVYIACILTFRIVSDVERRALFGRLRRHVSSPAGGAD